MESGGNNYVSDLDASTSDTVNYYNHPEYTLMTRNSYSDQQLNQNLKEQHVLQYSSAEPNNIHQISGNMGRAEQIIYTGETTSQSQLNDHVSQPPINKYTSTYTFTGNVSVTATSEIDAGVTNNYIKQLISQFMIKLQNIDYKTACLNIPEIVINNIPIENRKLDVELEAQLITPNHSYISCKDIAADEKINEELRKKAKIVKTKAQLKDYTSKIKSTKKLPLNRLRHHNKSPDISNNNDNSKKALEESSTLDHTQFTR